MSKAYEPRLAAKYRTEIRSQMQEQFKYTNAMHRLVNIALPRVRDFRGLNPKSFDGQGNYAMGIKDQTIFPEIDYDNIDQIWGMDVVVATSANTDEEARALLAAFDFPFPKKK